MIGTTFAEAREPDETTKVTSGYCVETRSAASWYSKPCPKIRPYPASAYEMKASSNSAGVRVCWCEMRKPSESPMSWSPS